MSTPLRPSHPACSRLDQEATHTYLPGVVISGTSSVELLGVDGFLLHSTWYDTRTFLMPFRARGEQVHYFDERGVLRLFALTDTADGWSVERSKTDDDFGQRMTWLVTPRARPCVAEASSPTTASLGGDLELVYGVRATVTDRTASHDDPVVRRLLSPAPLRLAVRLTRV